MILHAEAMTLAGMHMPFETVSTGTLRMLAGQRLARTNVYIDVS
ncbi:MAG: hypothetical protein ACJ8AI_01615 [Rhodopila sp.]